MFVGMYWIDPNGGSPVDAIEAFCDLSLHQTCVMAKPSQVHNVCKTRCIPPYGETCADKHLAVKTT